LDLFDTTILLRQMVTLFLVYSSWSSQETIGRWQ